MTRGAPVVGAPLVHLASRVVGAYFFAVTSPPPRAPRPLSPMRRELRTFAASVLALHLIALLGWAAARMAQRPRSTQTTYAAVWTAATVGLVVRGLIRSRRARGGS